MDSENTQLEGIYRLWAWAAKNKQSLIWAAVIASVGSLAVYFYVSKQEAAEVTAAEDLSKLRPTMTASGIVTPVRAETYLKLAADHSGTQAATRAQLLAAGTLFSEGKYPEALSQFERFLRDNPGSPFRTEALYGKAACLEAQGKTADAAAAFQAIVDLYPGDPVVSRAKLALARASEAQKKIEQAMRLYEELSRTESFSTVGMMAEARLEDLRQANPGLGARPPISLEATMPAVRGSNAAPAPNTSAPAAKAGR